MASNICHIANPILRFTHISAISSENSLIEFDIFFVFNLASTPRHPSRHPSGPANKQFTVIIYLVQFNYTRPIVRRFRLNELKNSAPCPQGAKRESALKMPRHCFAFDILSLSLFLSIFLSISFLFRYSFRFSIFHNILHRTIFFIEQSSSVFPNVSVPVCSPHHRRSSFAVKPSLTQHTHTRKQTDLLT